MRHVDEGTIHAWLDGQVSDPADAVWIERHCHTCDDCRARLDDERATRQQADALLSSIAPPAHATRSAYEALVAERGNRPEGGAPPVTRGPWSAPARLRAWGLAAGWAASVALAATLGWMIGTGSPDDRSVLQIARNEPSETPTPAASGRVPAAETAKATPESPAATTPRDADAASGETAAGALRTSPPSGEPRDTAGTAPPASAPRTQTEPRAGTAPAPPVGVPTRAQASSAPFASATESAVRDALPAGGSPDVQAEGASDIQFRTLLPLPGSGLAQPAGPPAAAQAPAASAPGASPASGGRGGRGGTASGAGSGPGSGGATGTPVIREAGSGRTVVIEPSAPAVSAFSTTERASSGRVRVDGLSLNTLPGATSTQATSWRQMPRTEAAARTGMALYGITGLTPSMTMLSAEGDVVRTIYMTAAGESVEIWQQRLPAPQAAGRSTAGGVILARPAEAFAGSWTAIYGDVQVTLRGGTNVASWGERLGVD